MSVSRSLVAGAVVAIALVLAMQWLAPDEPTLPPAATRAAEPPGPAGGTQPVAPLPAEPLPAQRPADDTVERAPREPSAAAANVPLEAEDDGSRRFVFDCGNGVMFAVRTLPGEATLYSPQALGSEVVTLPKVESGSGARYAEGAVSYWNKGGLATFEIRERLYADCTSNPGAAQTAEARRRAATFRARGHEPAWQLEISNDRIELATGLDARRVDYPYREAAVAGTRTTYRSFVGTDEIVVVIDAVSCTDTLSGEAFESTVTVTFENDTLYGCGETP